MCYDEKKRKKGVNYVIRYSVARVIARAGRFASTSALGIEAAPIVPPREGFRVDVQLINSNNSHRYIGVGVR